MKTNSVAAKDLLGKLAPLKVGGTLQLPSPFKTFPAPTTALVKERAAGYWILDLYFEGIFICSVSVEATGSSLEVEQLS